LCGRDENGVYHVIARRFGVLRFFYKTGTWRCPENFCMILYAAIALASAFFLPSGMWEVGIILSGVGFTPSHCALSGADSLTFKK
jgi:hypothetical protein